MYRAKLLDNEKLYDLKTKAYYIKELRERIEWDCNKIEINNNAKHRNSVIPKRGEIWTCQLGKNVGSEENKIRPVIIIQNNTGNEKAPTTIVIPISNRPKKIATHIELNTNDYVVEKNEVEMKKITGTILCEQIKVISKARLGRHIGTLNKEFISRILEPKLKLSIDL